MGHAGSDLTYGRQLFGPQDLVFPLLQAIHHLFNLVDHFFHLLIEAMQVAMFLERHLRQVLP